MNRGSPPHIGDQSTHANRFNEAPIHESGKLGRDRARLDNLAASMRPRFMNRGSPGVVDSDVFVLLASMRPRFMNRGSPNMFEPKSLGCVCFNEAPIHESGKSRPHSWGEANQPKLQ